MPVPDFNHNLTLPPHLGNPADISQLSPYPATSPEVCQKLGNTPERRTILAGWLAMRDAMRAVGFGAVGFQWLDGSFMENVELLENRPPGDLDVVTFAHTPVVPAIIPAGSPLQILINRAQTKATFRVDHLFVGLDWPPTAIVEWSRYWCGLFSHRRVDGIWKGMLRVMVNTPVEDAAAQVILNTANAAAANPPGAPPIAPPAPAPIANP